MTQMTNDLPSPAANRYTVWMRGTPVEFTSAHSSLAEAYHVLARSRVGTSDFARDLLYNARQRKLSPRQIAWIHYLATEAVAEAAPAVDVAPIVAMLGRAQLAGKRSPKIRLVVDGTKVDVVMTKAGRCGLVVGGEWRGAFPENHQVPEIGKFAAWVPTLKMLAENPAVVASQHGVATGCCSFCGRALSTKASRYVGYGPECADKWGMPWGEVPKGYDDDGKFPLEL
jgi:hypothetical protein